MTVSGVARTAILLLGFAAAACSRADAAAGKGSIEERFARLESRQEKLVAELASLRARVGGATRAELSAPLPEDPIVITDLPSLGVAARWALIEYSDFQCPFCRRYFADTFPRISRDYVQTGKLRYVFHNLPITGLHGEAVAAFCGGRMRTTAGSILGSSSRPFRETGPVQRSDFTRLCS